MEDNERGFSLCELIGKLVLKLIAIVAILAAAKIVLEKVFHKTICLSVAVEDTKDEDEEGGDEDEEEEDEESEDGEEKTEPATEE